jgi:hypothetical protein
MVLGRSHLDETGTIRFLRRLGQVKSRQDRSNLRIRSVLSGIRGLYAFRTKEKARLQHPQLGAFWDRNFDRGPVLIRGNLEAAA